MSEKSVFIGIDNGVSGSIGIITPDDVYFFEVPTKSEQSYTKTKKNITRIDFSILHSKLFTTSRITRMTSVAIERPMINPGRFAASISAARALEATIIALEELKYSYFYVDSKQWQRELLPKGVSGTTELKKASRDIGIRLYPQFKDEITKHKDADGLLIAHWLSGRKA